MPKYDNCKDCVRFCQYAGKNRKVPCYDGKTCKSTVEPVGAFDGYEMIADALRLLDIQRSHCLNRGADKEKRMFFSGSNGDKEQNSYYNGHLNLIDSMLLPLRKGVAINDDQKHYIYDLED